ncbi:MAG: D-glycero-beta-D-manno-heptose-7-phosphate kinase [Acidobacteria bacterium]|nr:MAG: D-glycero-beta-D-manno-heptose-7-phosphate kinase [Acidobacteriota bacterium]
MTAVPPIWPWPCAAPRWSSLVRPIPPCGAPGARRLMPWSRRLGICRADDWRPPSASLTFRWKTCWTPSTACWPTPVAPLRPRHRRRASGNRRPDDRVSPGDAMSRPTISIHRVKRLLDQFGTKRILVIGDLMLDEFIWGRASRISPEAPVPVVEIERESTHLGGAGNVVHNLRSLEADVVVLGVVGRDRAGDRISETLSELGAETSGLLVDPSRPTTVKTRIIAHNQQVVRADRESRRPLSPPLTEQLIARFTERLDECDGVVISDYDKGVITPQLLQRILPLAEAAGKPVFLDPKLRNFKHYSPVTLLKPNQREAEQITHIEIADEASLLEAGRTILQWLQCQHLLITRGELGMTLFSGDGQVTHIPTVTREVYDVTGAGDTTMAALALAFVSGAPPLEAAILANYAASVVIGKVGTVPVTPQDILTAIRLTDAES